MKKIEYLALCTWLLLSLGSCEENHIDKYSEPPAMYFLAQSSGGSWTATYNTPVVLSTNFGTIYDTWNRAEYALELRLQLQGLIQERPLTIRLKAETIDEYPIGQIEFETYVLPAGEYTLPVPIVIKRPALMNTLHKVKISIDYQNSDVSPGLHLLQSVTVDINDLLTLEMVGLSRALWDAMAVAAFGPYSETKLRFLAYAFYQASPALVNSYFQYIAIGFGSLIKATVENALNTYNAEHPNNPILDDDGTPLIFP